MSVSSAEDLLLSDSPQDAKLIALILKSMGVVDFEPAVVVQLLEFTHRYTTEVLTDAMQYAAHAEKQQTIDLDDLKLAIQARVNTSFTPAPSREILHSLAAAKNALPLPLPPKHAGSILPPTELRLAAPNWQIGIGVPIRTTTTTTTTTTTSTTSTLNAPPAKRKSNAIQINVSSQQQPQQQQQQHQQQQQQQQQPAEHQ